MIRQRAFVTEKYWLPRGRCDSATEAGHSVLGIQSLPWGFSEKGLWGVQDSLSYNGHGVNWFKYPNAGSN